MLQERVELNRKITPEPSSLEQTGMLCVPWALAKWQSSQASLKSEKTPNKPDKLSKPQVT